MHKKIYIFKSYMKYFQNMIYSKTAWKSKQVLFQIWAKKNKKRLSVKLSLDTVPNVTPNSFRDHLIWNS